MIVEGRAADRSASRSHQHQQEDEDPTDIHGRCSEAGGSMLEVPAGHRSVVHDLLHDAVRAQLAQAWPPGSR